MPKCNENDAEDAMKRLLENTFPPSGCDCLDPCSQDKYTFQVHMISVIKSHYIRQSTIHIICFFNQESIKGQSRVNRESI